MVQMAAIVRNYCLFYCDNSTETIRGDSGSRKLPNQSDVILEGFVKRGQAPDDDLPLDSGSKDLVLSLSN